MYFIYILANKTNTVLYIGVTNNLQRRVYEHKNKLIDGFTKQYKVIKLVYFEDFVNVEDALTAEKKLKGWKRIRKCELIQTKNQNWIDLSLFF